MGLTQSKLTVGDLIFDARLCGPEGGAVVVLLQGWPQFSSWWRDSLDALGAGGYRAVAFDQRGYSEAPDRSTWLNIVQTASWTMSLELWTPLARSLSTSSLTIGAAWSRGRLQRLIHGGSSR
jgi:pimeloyl-ACP methyl ester carboxylesterase